jgi:D-glycero-D-manno-heptose 1,7-bisphosphate phosphatase
MNRALFLDRDGVIIEDRGYMRDPGEVQLVAGAAPALHRLAEENWKLIVITNQSGVGRGLIAPAEMEAVQARVLELLREHNVELTATYICPHAPEANCRCRKPSPYLLQQAAREHCVDLTQSWMMGDRAGDILAGRAAGCQTIWFRNPRFPDGEGLATRAVNRWDEIAL